MKQNSIFEVICLVLALAGMVTKTAVDDPAIVKQLGGIALYGLCTIAVISKYFRFRSLPVTKGQESRMILGIILMVAAVVGEIIDPTKLYTAFWLVGIYLFTSVADKRYKEHAQKSE
jgi:hypothetical protein